MKQEIDMELTDTTRLSEEQVDQFAMAFLNELELPELRIPPRPFMIGIVKSPGTGGTTVGRQIAKALKMHLVQANSARFLLEDLEWGENAHRVVASVVDNILGRGWPIVLDGMLRTQKSRDMARALAKKHGAETFFVALTCAPRLAVKRARLRYADRVPSSFDDWRCSSKKFDEYLWSIVELATDLKADLQDVSSDVVSGVWQIENWASKDSLRLGVYDYLGTLKDKL